MIVQVFMCRFKDVLGLLTALSCIMWPGKRGKIMKIKRIRIMKIKRILQIVITAATRIALGFSPRPFFCSLVLLVVYIS